MISLVLLVNSLSLIPLYIHVHMFLNSVFVKKMCSIHTANVDEDHFKLPGDGISRLFCDLSTSAIDVTASQILTIWHFAKNYF